MGVIDVDDLFEFSVGLRKSHPRSENLQIVLCGPGLLLFVLLCFPCIILDQVPFINKSHAVRNVGTGSGISIIFDLLQICLRIRDALQIFVPGSLNELKVSLYTVFHGIVNTKVCPDRCLSTSRIFFFSSHVNAYAFPCSSAFEAKIIVIFCSQYRFSVTALQDSLCNDCAGTFNSIGWCMLLYQGCNLCYKILLAHNISSK